MMRFLSLLLIGSLFSGAAMAAGEADPVLGKREVLCVVEFPSNSNDLDARSRVAVEAVLGKISQVDTATRLIRIEGFARPDEQGNTLLALERARAVDEFIRFRHNDRTDRCLTGIVAADVSGQPPYRAEIVIYDNLFAAAGDPLEIYSKETR